ncbi:bifunctional [glutamine synthetase] adenylyltransferase/[glutamine synthetase]-adenylyl-L-tyrosine phosphorylase [Mumia sp. zg.B17]|uniref:bifunctional [glutamine synthetase] adenylyltransferase/[glutamine synthetase]-adenylyl-L-tyrosine phosphorylase n=1 Tax=Mumia sp. zg.B17 TaxID=2855446 RepID=UPI0027E2366D|nr:bifunctional [glutamine synthetase] adenylyltransferase/[glutamine synthetase]-adenylyl-L-tyrosine phosphorylase [Mumia sp. zg.B17]
MADDQRPQRLRTTSGWLARLGFADADGASRLLHQCGVGSEAVVERVAHGADPDLALRHLCEVAAAYRELPGVDDPDLVSHLEADPELLTRLVAVLGASRALGEFLVIHPEAVLDLRATTMPLAPRDQHAFEQVLADVDDPDALRVAYKRQLLQIAARDLTRRSPYETTSAELADLAGATLSTALRLARHEVDDSDAARLAVVAMGKCGGRELNYVSDVDVIFVHAPADGADEQKATKVATRLAAALIRICGEHTREGTIWEVDANLRPEGKDGPLVRTLSSHVAYYERWASTWEFQALLKARPVAGDAELGQDYVDALAPMVWQAATRPNFMADTRSMRRRVIDNIPAPQLDRELKLGPGGLRDVEFAVQLLQLVHGRTDERLRVRSTTDALRALVDGGYVGRTDGAAMTEAYTFLRMFEHRIQLDALRRTHLVPTEDDTLRMIGRTLAFRSDPAKNLVKEWQAQRREVLRLHHKLFYRPLLDAVASMPSDALRLTPEAAQARLEALGYADPRAALIHIKALTSGVRRSAAIQRHLMPAMLAWFADSPNPDGGLLAFRKVSESLGATHWYLRKLRDEGAGAEQLAKMLAGSAYVTDLIQRAPEAVAMLGDDSQLEPRTYDRIATETRSAVRRHASADEALRTVRRVRRRELSRIAMSDVLGRLDIVEVGHALSDLTAATLDAALQIATRTVEGQRGAPVGTRIAVVLMGRLGGRESAYGSDADVMFVHDPLPDTDESAATQAASAVATELRRMVGTAGPDPALEVDADLRPEGRSGPLVRTLASYRAYYARWSMVWEAQALLRAAPVVGDPDLCAAFREMVDPLRWPEAGVSDDDVREIRRIKARVDSERLPRGADPATHLKLGRGGIADVEWTVQLLQMQHASTVEGLRTTETLPALHAAAEAGLLASEEAAVLEEAWRLVSRIRNAYVLLRNRPVASLPENANDRAGVAWLLGYGIDGGEHMVDDYLRATRRARHVVEHVFWG